MIVKRTFIFALMMFAIITTSQAEDVVVLVNHEVGKSELSKRVIKKIFLGRYKTSGSGVSISPCYLDNGDVGSKLTDISKKSPETYRRYWNKRLFSGAGSLPKTFQSKAQLYQYMVAEKGAVCLTVADDNVPETIDVVSLD